MTTVLKDAVVRAQRVARAGFPRPPTTQPEIERQIHALDQQVGEVENVEALRPFLERASTMGTAPLRRFELNRVLRGAWCEEDFDCLGREALVRASDVAKRSSDQALIEGYLSWFPRDRAVIEDLARAAQTAADRHDWAWRRRAAEWRLFDHTAGPGQVGAAVAAVRPGAAADLLSAIGIGRQIAATQFGRAAFVAACRSVATLRGARATEAQSGLIALFDTKVQASDLPELARALLEPWVSDKPGADHRKELSGFLLDQVGDPRSAPGRWAHILATLAEDAGPPRAEAIVNVLKRWLTDVAMREFFRAIAETTDRPDQWKQRSTFWLAYLDAGMVSDAWPALGYRARYGIEEIIRQSGERPEYGVMHGGPLSSSAIILQIGDVRIAEWSDNGACRFWRDSDRSAPKLYAKKYHGEALRTTSGGAEFEYHSHVPASPGWEAKFAGVIHRRTNVAHPILGRGRARTWSDRW